MRTRLGVMGRLLAHITALALLVLMLVYVRPEEEKPPLPPAPPMSGFTAPSRPPVVPEAITPMPIPSATGESAASSGEISAPAEIKPEPDAPSGASSGSALPGFDPATIGIIESGSEGTTEPVPPISPEVVDSPVPVISAVPEPEPIPVPEPDEIPVPAEDSEPIVPAEPEQSETTGPSIPQPAVDQATPQSEPVITDSAEASVGVSSTPEPGPEFTAPQSAGQSSTIAEISGEILPLAEPQPTAEPLPAAVPESPLAPDVGSDSLRPGDAPDDAGEAVEQQPDESGSLVVAESATSLPQAVTSPLSNLDLEVLGEGVYWLAKNKTLEDALPAMPDRATVILLSSTGGNRAPIAGYPVVNIEAMQSNLNFDSAAHFIHLTSGPSLPAVVVAEPDAVGTAFFKGVYLLANRNMTFAEVVTAIEPDLASQPESRSQILHLLRRLDVDALRQTYGASQAVTEPEPAVEADDAGSVQTVAVEADDESGTSQTDDGTGLDNDVIPADSSPESTVDMVAGSGGSL